MDACPVKTYEKESRLSQKPSLPARDNLKINSYLPVIDSLIVGFDAYQFLCSIFVFLSNILRMSNEELRKSAAFLRECYADDLEESLASELVRFAAMMKNIPSNTDDSTHGLELKLFRILHENHLLELFSNVEILFRIYLCMFVTNCTGERSFLNLN